mmetsp:Transcript_6781/g.30570  ORF Transcript_6781/g.30570 Transcript_6781/m.30570 type:complete len:207 (+) Transcript_6781:589-1209(+)
MESTVVLENSLTTTAPLASSSTPASFKPRSGRSVLGTRPVAHITQSHSIIVPLSSSRVRDPSSFLVTAFGLAPAWISVPREPKLVATVSRTSWSNPRRGRSARYTMSVLDPRPWKIPANSTAMYPPPMTTTRLGWCSNASASSEVMPSSAPGMSGFHALPPGARRMVLAVTVCFLPSTSVISTELGPVTRPAPSYFSTPAPSRRRP